MKPIGMIMMAHFNWPQSQSNPASLRQSEGGISESWRNQLNPFLHREKSYPSPTQVHTLDLAQSALLLSIMLQEEVQDNQ